MLGVGGAMVAYRLGGRPLPHPPRFVPSDARRLAWNAKPSVGGGGEVVPFDGGPVSGTSVSGYVRHLGCTSFGSFNTRQAHRAGIRVLWSRFWVDEPNGIGPRLARGFLDRCRVAFAESHIGLRLRRCLGEQCQLEWLWPCPMCLHHAPQEFLRPVELRSIRPNPTALPVVEWLPQPLPSGLHLQAYP